MRRVIAATALAVAIAVLAAAPAYADFTVSNFSAAPSSTQAGAHSAFNVSFDLGGSETIRDLDLMLPPGLVGNPSSATRCSVDAFNANGCAPTSQVGTTAARATASGGLPADANGEIFNLVPNAGEPARLGIHLTAAGGSESHLQSQVSIRTATDFGLTSTLRGLPNQASLVGVPVSIHIDQISLTLNANAANGPFMTNPTSCAQATTQLRAVGYGDSAATAQASFTPTGCGSETYAPKLTAALSGATATRGLPQLVTVISQRPGEANTRSVTVTLPRPLGPNPLALQNICLVSDFNAGRCPAASTVGDARVVTPLLPGALTGPVRLVENPGQPFPRLAIDLSGLISFRLIGDLALQANSATSTFAGIPDVPLSSFTLTLVGGRNGLLANVGDLCTAPVVLGAQFSAHSGASLNTRVPATVDGCTGRSAAAPAVSASLRGLAGRAPSLRLGVKPPAGDSFRTVTVTLPRGLAIVRKQAAQGVRVSAARRLPRGVSVRGARTLRVSRTVARKLTLIIGRGALHASRKLQRLARSHPQLKLQVTVVDASGKSSKVVKTITAR
jgi:hypothetical protein